MNRSSRLTKSAVLFLSVMFATSGMVSAHEATCPFCEMDVVQNTPQQDNEVALKYGKKRIEYRCVLCAIADAKQYEGDLTVLAPTEIKGKPAILTRTQGQWTSAPDNLLFVGEKVKHRHCQLGYRAFTSKAAFDAHVQKNKAIIRNAQPIDLAQMVKLSESYAKE